jgi:glycosyltransferase involved in cell wall biosynthesis
MRISAVIPAYNAEEFIVGAIESIRCQDVAVDEILVVDDGSRDKTAEIVEGLGGNVILLRQKNRGPSAARNLGLKLARGEMIAFLDADDRWTPDKLRTQLAAFERHPELDLVASDMAEVDPIGTVLVPSVLDKHGLLQDFYALDGAPIPRAVARLVDKNFIPTGTVLARRAVFECTGGFKEHIRYGEDLELWARIAARHPIACLPNVHLLRTQHANNTTKSTGPMLRDLVEVMRSLSTECGDTLAEQGTPPGRPLAKAWGDLGYWHFDNLEMPEARQAMYSSFKCAPSTRTMVYGLAACLPKRLVSVARSLKQTLGS